MNLSLSHRLLHQESLSNGDVQALLGTAESLLRAAQAGIEQRPLKGKNIAVLCRTPDCPCAREFEAAATGLGARVSRIPPDAALLLDDHAATHDTLKMLSRLYDAIECDELPLEVARRLHRTLGVPVYDGPARNDHPLQRLAVEGISPGYLLQALLVNTLA